MVWTFHEDELDRPDVTTLLALHFSEMRANSPPAACHVLDPDGLRAPGIVFWSLREDGRLLGVGALKRLAADHGEVKSMRTAPDALGRGAGRAMLRQLIADGRRRGFARISLETGSTADFAAALRLYESEGFVPCGPFGGYLESPFTRFLTRAI
ncbi:MAG: GNAT family N-acetyltransferase [Allosphingosinicella sp.]|uniref:GNAT family N-acetyltransferase n=1 Tax=Allosphingosinicella sp. TaxID=2823234 RepID=UPI003953FA3A